jgi:hypothetical protein
VGKAVVPPGAARPAAQVLSELLARAGRARAVTTPAALFAELVAAVPAYNVSDAAAHAETPVSGTEGTLAGLEVTLTRMVRSLLGTDNVTIQYPAQRKPYSRRFRGVHVLTQRADGSLKCVACYLCAVSSAASASTPALRKR